MREKLDADIKTAMLSGDKIKAETLKGIKAALLNEEISLGVRDSGLNEEQTLKVLARESKKRTEAAEMYKTGGAQDRAEAELAEKTIIDQYLPEQVSEDQIREVISAKISELGATNMADMGKVIGAVKAQLGATADGALIASLVKENLQ
jgi:uncharacterized protein